MIIKKRIDPFDKINNHSSICMQNNHIFIIIIYK